MQKSEKVAVFVLIALATLLCFEIVYSMAKGTQTDKTQCQCPRYTRYIQTQGDFIICESEGIEPPVSYKIECK